MEMNRKKTHLTDEPVITAIDLGTSKITVIISLLNEDGVLEVKGFGEIKSKGIENGIIKDIKLTSEAIKTAIETAEYDSDMKAENLFVSIAGKFIKSSNTSSRLSISDPINTEPGEITEEHIEKVIQRAVELVFTQEGDKNQKLIHSIPQYYKVDEQDNILNPCNMSGYILTAHIHTILADINCIRNIHRCFELIGYSVKQLVLAPLAASKAILSDDEKHLGCVLIDIGAGTTDVIFFYKKSIMFTSIKPYGGNDINLDISSELKTSYDGSEDLKRRYADVLFDNSNPEAVQEQIEVMRIGFREPIHRKRSLLCDIVHRKVKDILQDIYVNLTSLNYHNYMYAGAIITGGSSKLENLEHLTGDIFNMPVRIGLPILKQLTGKTDKIKSQEYATVVGILYYAKDFFETPGKNNSNGKQQKNNAFKKFLIKFYEDIRDFF